MVHSVSADVLPARLADYKFPECKQFETLSKSYKLHLIFVRLICSGHFPMESK